MFAAKLRPHVPKTLQRHRFPCGAPAGGPGCFSSRPRAAFALGIARAAGYEEER